MSKIERAPFFDSLGSTDRRGQAARRGGQTDGDGFRRALVEKAERASDDASGDARHRRAGDASRLFDDIERISKELREKLTWSAVMEYKTAVGELLTIAKGEIFRATEIVSRQGDGNSKRFLLVQEIDNKINAMVAQFLQQQHAQLRILEMVGEINGLVVNLQF